jgi:ribosome-binding factor A
MTTLTNEQMLKNVMTILSKMDIKEKDDFKKEMNKVIKNAMKDKTTVKKTKELKEDRKLSGYQQFVKDKMPEMKLHYDHPNDRLKAIGKLWKEQKKSSGSE